MRALWNIRQMNEYEKYAKLLFKLSNHPTPTPKKKKIVAILVRSWKTHPNTNWHWVKYDFVGVHKLLLICLYACRARLLLNETEMKTTRIFVNKSTNNSGFYCGVHDDYRVCRAIMENDLSCGSSLFPPSFTSFTLFSSTSLLYSSCIHLSRQKLTISRLFIAKHNNKH